jgi:hypothetical protein
LNHPWNFVIGVLHARHCILIDRLYRQTDNPGDFLPPVDPCLSRSVVRKVQRNHNHPLVPGGIPNHGSIHDVRGGTLIEVSETSADSLTASYRYGPV